MVKIDCYGVLVMGGQFLKPRLRVRKVDEYGQSLKTAVRSVLNDEICVSVKHGGTVANAYGYSAETEGAIAIAHNGIVKLWFCRLRANGTTLSGVCNQCIPSLRPLFDDRCKEATKELARQSVKTEFESVNQIYLQIKLDEEFLGMIRGKTPVGVLCDWLIDERDIFPPENVRKNVETLVQWLAKN